MPPPFHKYFKENHSQTEVCIFVSRIRKLFKITEVQEYRKSKLIILMTENLHLNWYPLTSSSLRQSVGHEKLRSKKSFFYNVE